MSNPKPLELCAEQGTAEWLAARRGMITGSRIAAILPGSRGAYSTRRDTLFWQLLAERLAEMTTEHYVSRAMQHGIDMESRARAQYIVETGNLVDTAGFYRHPVIELAGASPDGLIGADGLLEIKCPESSTHLRTVYTQIAPEQYLPQIQWELACTERQWCDFVSFDDRLPERLTLRVIRVERDPEMIGQLELEAVKFLAEIEQIQHEIDPLVAVREDAAHPFDIG